MDITSTFTMTPRQSRRSYRACIRGWAYVPWLFVGLLVVQTFVADNLFYLILAVVYGAFWEWIVRRRLKPMLDGPQSVTVWLTDESYRARAHDIESTVAWSGISAVRRTGDFWVLRLHGKSVAFPLEALDVDQNRAFSDFLRSRGLLKE